MLHLYLLLLLPVVFANPFQKYPYVFLLDVGNEEIGKFSTQQIRLSIPGGSLAVRYPAVGEGDTIGHVRVSGIDFGTDLKASIIQGGPGYKYAVFVFMGNPSTPYDAVVTIQTVPDNMEVNIPKLEPSTPKLEAFDKEPTNTKFQINNKIYNKESRGQELEEANDSSEDMSDNSVTKAVYKGNKKQIMQESSNVYHYTSKNAENDEDFQNGVEPHSTEDFNDQDENEEDDDEEEDYKSGENGHSKSGYSDESSDDAQVSDFNRNQYGIYEAFKPHWLGGVRFYPQAALYAQDSYGKRVSGEENERRNNEEISEQYYIKDINNNIDDFGPAVEYKK